MEKAWRELLESQLARAAQWRGASRPKIQDDEWPMEWHIANRWRCTRGHVTIGYSRFATCRVCNKDGVHDTAVVRTSPEDESIEPKAEHQHGEAQKKCGWPQCTSPAVPERMQNLCSHHWESASMSHIDDAARARIKAAVDANPTAQLSAIAEIAVVALRKVAELEAKVAKLRSESGFHFEEDERVMHAYGAIGRVVKLVDTVEVFLEDTMETVVFDRSELTPIDGDEVEEGPND